MSLHLTAPVEIADEHPEAMLAPVERQQAAVLGGAASMPAVQQPQEVAVVEPQEVTADPVMALAVAISRLPGIDREMFREIMAQQAAERAAQALERYNDAMALCQAEIAPVVRTAENSQTRSWYAKLEAVDGAIRPIYIKHGFNVRYNTVPPLVPGNIRVECAVSLGRHTEKFYREAAPDTTGPQGRAVKTALHGGGSTETYLKRYLVCGAFNVVFRNMDDDGVRGSWKKATDDQVAELVELLKNSGQSEPRFLMRMASDADGNPVKKFEDLGAHDFIRVANTLRLMVDRKKDNPNEDHPA